MRLLVTGSSGYIGVRLVRLAREAGHDVTGLDNELFAGCDLGAAAVPRATVVADVRDIVAEQLEGFDAVLHLAGISNDPLGNLRPETTLSVNTHGTLVLAEAAKRAGVARFLFSSSCSLYGAQGDVPIDESASWNPVTVYGESKLLSEQGLSKMADDGFSPTYLRNATAYGVSERLRGDLVVNNLVGYAVTTGRVHLKSDGTPWRPLVHVEDIARAFVALAEAPRELVHDEAFNVGRTSENYRIREVAEIVADCVPGSTVEMAAAAGPDLRNYRVSCEKLESTVPGYRPIWTVAEGVRQLRDAYEQAGLTLDDLEGSRFQRLRRIEELSAAGRVDGDLRCTEDATR